MRLRNITSMATAKQLLPPRMPCAVGEEKNLRLPDQISQAYLSKGTANNCSGRDVQRFDVDQTEEQPVDRFFVKFFAA